MWLDTVVLIEAAAVFWLSAVNVALLGRVVSQAQTEAKRAAGVVLMCVCGGQAMEALLFLWLSDASGASGWTAAALLMVRSALLVSTALISLLLLRALSLRP